MVKLCRKGKRAGQVVPHWNLIPTLELLRSREMPTVWMLLVPVQTGASEELWDVYSLNALGTNASWCFWGAVRCLQSKCSWYQCKLVLLRSREMSTVWMLLVPVQAGASEEPWDAYSLNALGTSASWCFWQGSNIYAEYFLSLLTKDLAKYWLTSCLLSRYNRVVVFPKTICMSVIPTDKGIVTNCSKLTNNNRDVFIYLY